MTEFLFHPAVHSWFSEAFEGPTEIQRQAWPEIKKGNHVLISAPTGSGKTLAAFLTAINSLIEEGVTGFLPHETSVLYISPLKALSNDIEVNLREPLKGVKAKLEEMNLPDPGIRVKVRTGDTPPSERTAMRFHCAYLQICRSFAPGRFAGVLHRTPGFRTRAGPQDAVRSRYR